MLYVGLLATIAAILILAIVSGLKKGKNNGQGISGTVAAGLIMGTLVGGTSTVGTAQLAYNYGLSAWWFTLGAGLGCLCMAIFFIKPLRQSGCVTITSMVTNEYGPRAGSASSILNSIGTFINIISQIIAASSVVLVILPNTSMLVTILISAVFMILYVVFGGTKGAGIVGMLKMILLYFAMIVCGVIALKSFGGYGSMIDAVKQFSNDTGRNFLSLLCRGAGTDIGAGISLILGVLTTQTYAQAVFMARSDRAARGGTLISAFLIPIIGIFGIMVGLYMRTVTDPATFAAKTALTSFILDYSGMPQIISGIVLGALFIASVGTGAGLALGFTTIFRKNIIKTKSEEASLKLEKPIITAVLLFAAFLCCTPIGDTILNFAVMSMGLRACAVFPPLLFVIIKKDSVSAKCAFISIITGTCTALILGVLKTINVITMSVDPVFPGLIIGFAVMLIGYFSRKKTVLQ